VQQQQWEQMGTLRAQVAAAQSSLGAVSDQIEEVRSLASSKADREQVQEQLASLAAQLGSKAGKADLEAGLALKVDMHTYLAASAAQAKAMSAAGLAGRASSAGQQRGAYDALNSTLGTGSISKRGTSAAGVSRPGSPSDGGASDVMIRAVYSELQSVLPPDVERGPSSSGADVTAEAQQLVDAVFSRRTLSSSPTLVSKLPQQSRFSPAAGILH
jgi:hypothetical protein